MRTFDLIPIDPMDPNWAASERKEPARIRAEKPEDARAMAAAKWGVCPEHFGGEPPRTPWLYDDLVDCVGVEEDEEDGDGPPERRY